MGRNVNSKKVPRTVAVLKLPQTVSLLITFVQAISKALTGNPAFPTPNPPLTALSGAVSDLQLAETAALTRATGTVATRNERRAVLVTLLEVLRTYVQQIADGSPENAISIIEGARLALTAPVAGRRAADAAVEGDAHRLACRNDGPVPLPLGHQGRSG